MFRPFLSLFSLREAEFERFAVFLSLKVKFFDMAVPNQVINMTKPMARWRNIIPPFPVFSLSNGQLTCMHLWQTCVVSSICLNVPSPMHTDTTRSVSDLREDRTMKEPEPALARYSSTTFLLQVGRNHEHSESGLALASSLSVWNSGSACVAAVSTADFTSRQPLSFDDCHDGCLFDYRCDYRCGCGFLVGFGRGQARCQSCLSEKTRHQS